MTDITVTPEAASGDHADDGHAHPTDALFVRTAVILAIITAFEVGWSYLPWWDGAHGLRSFIEISGLLIMMMAKFIIVANVFMHLKFDKPLLSWAFYFGFVLAVIVYMAVLTTFEIWSSGPPGFAP
ncbi:MAG: cytochrome C oxidase subunit IV family protein [Actinobacteria bacterium]|nr:cytochrome C oxidase subunit IV family protein [Actinomycetota bacterium]